MTVLATMIDKIRIGLKRQTITLCSDWAGQYRVMGKPFSGPYTTKYHPWCKAMMDWDGDWVGPKAAQMGFTEVALNRTFFTIDIKQNHCMYILPKTTPDATDFSASRFDPALELSPHLKQMFSDVQNVGHKRAGAVNLYVRGAVSKSGLKSVPASLLVFDELDEMSDSNVTLAEERQSGQTEKQKIKISTPTIPEFGIDVAYQSSTQEHFMFVCPSCSKLTELTFPECLVITADRLNDPRLKETHLRCKECGNTLPHEAKPDFLSSARWVSTKNNDAAVRGFHINQLYSPTVSPEELAIAYIKSLTSQAKEQEFFNSKLGQAHVVDGARVSDEIIDATVMNRSRQDDFPSAPFIVMGVDVGKWLHYEICTYYPKAGASNDLNVMSDCVQITAGKVAQFEELDKLMYQYQISACVIDANPERRKAYEFALRFRGRVYMCFYSNGLRGKDMNINEEACTVSVDRTSWLDMSIGRFHGKTIKIPKDTSQEYRSHIKALVRKYEEDVSGHPVGVWVSLADDHFGHARNYAEIALPLAAMVSTGKNISEFL